MTNLTTKQKKATKQELREALLDMVEQYAFENNRGGREYYWTGGMGALENAFDALGWNDPQLKSEVRRDL